MRSIAYFSQDPTFIDIYESGKDSYMELAKLTWPALYESMPRADFKENYRSIAKQAMISTIYNRGAESLAEGMGCSVEDVKRVGAAMFDQWKNVDRMRRSLMAFAENTGRAETYLGDRLNCDKSRFYTTAVNYPTQGNAACILMEGFFNALHHIHQAGYEAYSETVIHDSNTNMVRIENLPEIDLIYRKYFRQYIREKYGADYKYDLDLLYNFADKTSWSLDISTHEAEISGRVEDVDYIWKHMSVNRDVTLISEEFEENTDNQFDNFIYYAEWRSHEVCSLPEFNSKGSKTLRFKINDEIKGEHELNESLGEDYYFDNIKSWKEHKIDYKFFNIPKDKIDELEKFYAEVQVEDNPNKVYPCEIADKIRAEI